MKNRGLNLLTELKKIRNKLNADVKRAKSNYYLKFFCGIGSDLRKIWGTVNSLTNRKANRQSISRLTVDGKTVPGKELAT